ncbi:hypothetical protein ACLK19_28270 [Escherichia coli]
MIWISQPADENLHSWRSGAGAARLGADLRSSLSAYCPCTGAKTSQIVCRHFTQWCPASWFLTTAV